MRPSGCVSAPPLSCQGLDRLSHLPHLIARLLYSDASSYALHISIRHRWKHTLTSLGWPGPRLPTEDNRFTSLLVISKGVYAAGTETRGGDSQDGGTELSLLYWYSNCSVVAPQMALHGAKRCQS